MQHNLTEQVRETVQEFHMIREGEHIAVGVSGGADSVCLLLLLNELAGEFGIYVAFAKRRMRTRPLPKSCVKGLEYR